MGTCYSSVFSDNGLIQFNGVRKCRGHLQVTRGLGCSYLSLPMGQGLSTSHLQYRAFYLALVSTRLGMTLVPFWEYQSPPGVMSWSIQLLWLKNNIPARSGEKVSYPHPSTRSYSEIRNSSGSTNHLVSMLAGEFWGRLRGLAWAIRVSAQLQPPCCPRFFNANMQYQIENYALWS